MNATNPGYRYGSPEMAHEASPQQIGVLLRRLSVENDRFTDRMSAERGLHRTDMHALSFIIDCWARREPVTPGRLGAALGISSPATTALVDRLQRANLVRRERSEIDRREFHLTLQPEALELGRQTFHALVGPLQHVIAEYGEERASMAMRFLDDLVHALRDAGTPDAPPMMTTASKAAARPTA